MNQFFLKPLRLRLENIAKQHNLRLGIIEQDYVLSWLLVGVFSHPNLRSTLIFKGGTGLKKGYFGDYRFSEDLDFSAYPEAPKGEALFQSLSEACIDAEVKARVYAPIRMFIRRYTEKLPHPGGQEAFIIRAQFPWHREPLTTVMIEISRDENILYQPVSKQLLHRYGEVIDQKMHLYALEEIVIEKLRAILQHTKKLHERDWNRSRARDYYDLWCIFNSFGEDLVLDGMIALLHKKCSSKNVVFASADSFFDAIMVGNVTRTWQQWLGPLVPGLPDCGLVLKELRERISELFQQALA